MTMTFSALVPLGVLLLRRGMPVIILLVISTGLIGCLPSIEVQPVSPLPRATVAPDERGLAIIGVDFDPPLEAGQILAGGGVTLLVALENKGRQAEPVAQVTARLYDPDSDSDSDLVNETVTIRSLAPGELRVVRFTQVTDLPVRSAYKLEVTVAPVPGEIEREDNSRTYDIIVHPE